MPPFLRTSGRLLVVLTTVLATALSLGVGPATADGPPTPSPGPSGLGHSAAGQVLDLVQDLLVPDGEPGPATAEPSQPSAVPDLTLAMRDLALARRSLSGREAAQADRILARPTDYIDNNDTDPINYTGAEMRQLHRTCSKHFCVHWTSASNIGRYCDSYGDCYRVDNRATRRTANRDLEVLEHVYRREVGRDDFRRPPADRVGASTVDVGNPDPRFDVFLADLGALGYYGYTAVSRTDGQRASAYLVLDNSFSKSKFCPPTEPRRRCTSPLDNLRVTVAHEFFHAIQYGYDVTESSWLMEGSAVWMEDRVYDGINDYRQYLPASPIKRPRLPVDDNGRRQPLDVYGAFALFKFLTDWLHDTDAVRQVWQYAAPLGVYSLQAVDKVLTAHGEKPAAAFARFGVWNTLPRGSYPGERGGYGRAHYWHKSTLGGRQRSTGWRSVRLRHLANAPVRLRPTKGLGRHSRLRIDVNLPRRSHDPVATVQVRRPSGKVVLRTIRLNKYGNGHRTVWFFRQAVSSVVVVLSNGSTTMAGCTSGNPDPYTCGGRGVHDKQRYRVRARLTRS